MTGVTTGAGMWLSGAIGLCIGFGYWPIAGLAMLAVLITLAAIYKLEQMTNLRQPETAAAERSRSDSGC